MKSEAVIRDEPGEYRVMARYGENGTFSVHGESVRPITLTVRVEDAWERIQPEHRRYAYSAAVRKDGKTAPIILNGVAPDARIFIDFAERFDIEFS